MTTTQGIKLDQETRKRLEILAQKRDRSPHWLMCTAIKLYVEREEAIEREKREDLERWENYMLTGKAISTTNNALNTRRMPVESSLRATLKRNTVEILWPFRCCRIIAQIKFALVATTSRCVSPAI